LTETVNGRFKAEVIHRRGPWRSYEAIEYATLEWIDWFNNHRLREPIGNIPPAKAEANFYAALERPDLAAWLRQISLRQTRRGSPAQDAGLLRENERLRKENHILKEGGEGGAKKSGDVLRGTKTVKFQFIAAYHGELTQSRLCRLMGVSDCGLRASKRRPPSPWHPRPISAIGAA
jgi:hypothetical protein